MTPAQIDAKLGAASSSTTDNVAQDIVSSLTTSQIRMLPPRTIAILMQCLKETWFSANDKKAFEKLKNNIGMTIIYPTKLTGLYINTFRIKIKVRLSKHGEYSR
jgi:hypothetical protein